MNSDLTELGVALVRGALPRALTSQWLEIADRQYTWIEALARSNGMEAVRRELASGQHYLPHVSSISLGGVYAGEEWQSILDGLAIASVREVIEQALGGPVVCDLDRAWVRRQFAIHRRPQGHTPHSWHQDGALLYPFELDRDGVPAAGGLLPMVTCWLALTSCGSQAPGLEFVRQHLDSLVAPAALTDDRLRARFPGLFWKPAMDPGDIVIFSGGTLHRTQVDPDMQADRTSIELRFFRADAIPGRVAEDRFAGFPTGPLLR